MKKMKGMIKRILGSMVLACCLIAANLQAFAATITSADSAIIEVKSYEIEEGTLKAGEQVTLQLTIHNTSATAETQNTILTYTSADDALYPVYGEDNQIYIGTIEAGKTKQISIQMMVAKDYNAEYAKVNLAFDYMSANNVVNNNVVLNIPTYASGQLTSESVIVTGNATVGVNALVSIRCKNGGNTDIQNAKLVLSGNIDQENTETDLPTIGAGKTYSQDYFVRFTESGIQNLMVAYKYTDTEGNEYTVDCGEYKVSVTTDAAADNNEVVVVEQTSSGNAVMIQIGLLIIACIITIISVVVYLKKRK